MDKATFFERIKSFSNSIVSISDLVDDMGYYHILATMKSPFYKEHLIVGYKYNKELSESDFCDLLASALGDWFMTQLLKRQEWRSNFGNIEGWVSVG